tara:strand:+ start:256 stop:969 length:714 start_codon:yes stop_codon:yes gene_type:complete
MYKVNVSIDDVSPHPLSSTRVLKRCYDLIEEFDDIKFTLFVPISYWRTMPPDYDRADTRTKTSLQIDLYPEFCEELKKLPDKNFEIGYHGFYHGIPEKSNNDEFQHLTYEQAVKKFELMFETVKQAGLKEKFKPIFRPPAWRMSPDSIKASKEVGFEILALSPKQEYGDISTGQNLVYYNVNPPFDPLMLCEKTEMVYHACEWDKNYLSEKKTEELAEVLRRRVDDIDFCFMGDLLK